MSEIHPNPMGREYSEAEWAAARRLGLATEQTVKVDGQHVKVPGGLLIYGTGPGWPDEIQRRIRRARRDLSALETLSAAMEREWAKPLPPRGETND